MTPLDGLRILLVEDDVLLAMEMEDLLLDLGCEVVGPHGRLKTAMRAAEVETLDGAVLDLNLHGELSFPLVEELRERGVPVIVCSGYADLPSIRDRCAGVHLLSKPYDLARIASVLAEQFASAGPRERIEPEIRSA